VYKLLWGNARGGWSGGGVLMRLINGHLELDRWLICRLGLMVLDFRALIEGLKSAAVTVSIQISKPDSSHFISVGMSDGD